jgi:RHS repeat-associated protein
MVDDTGFTVNYSYDTVGNLANLTDGSGNLIVRYSYDAVGRLSREDHGNGTYVTYEYDAAGELLHLVNYAPDGTINSRFDYTYDSPGRRITETTSDGEWAYSYDSIGELTHAVFTSSNDFIANQDLYYAYDAAGNLTQTIINGITTAYITNNMNEYTQAGNTQYSYDANGNLVSTTGTSDVTNYTYNVQNQLIGVSNTNGSWTYQYDAFGNRIATTQSGQTTQYLIDPSGLRNLVAAFNSNNGLISHYTYGLGLISQLDANAVASYYDFDAVGSTVGITDTSGVYTQTYAYTPFGQTLNVVGNAANLFLFGGESGVQSDTSGLTFMRARYYSASIGRFVEPDPVRSAGGDTDYYRFVGNNPVLSTDPTGLGRFEFILGHFQYRFDDGTTTGFGPVNEFTDWNGQVYPVQLDNNPHIILPGYYNDEFIRTILRTHDYDFDTSWYFIVGHNCYDWVKAVRQTYLCYGDPQEPHYLRLLVSDLGELVDALGAKEQAFLAFVANSFDPNGKFGPAGYGSEAFISPSNPFPYHIDFENDPTATAPAQRVDVTDQLDPNLDWSTFQWTGFGFGDNVISIPPDTQHYETTLPMTYNRVTFRVVIDLDLDPLTGMVHASFQSLNAANLMTGLAQCPGTLSLGPANPDAELPPPVTVRFLPPEDGTGRGMGYLTYTVQPRSGLATGTQVRNVADVTFDLGNTIATDQVSETDPTLGVDPNKQDLVTIDSGPPTSSVAALPAVTSVNAFIVSWSGTDDPGGSGIASYTVSISDNGGPFTPWLTNTTQTSATYVGQDGHTYAFYSVATDNVGNVQPTPTTAQATTTVDATPPTSTVAALPAFSPGTFTLSWSGTDFNNVGIASYSVYVSDDGGAFTPLLTNTTQTSLLFMGENGHTYGFYSVATDNLGNQQLAPTSAQASTTVDSVPPTSSVAALPAVSPPTFTVSWSGSDNAGGSGLASFNVYVSDDGGPFMLLLADTTQTSATYTGQAGHTYGFYSVATDNVGNIEAIPTAAEATTLVQIPTSTTAASGTNPSVYGQSVTFTVVVTGTLQGGGTPTGIVTFLDGSTTLGTATLDNTGQASLSTAGLSRSRSAPRPWPGLTHVGKGRWARTSSQIPNRSSARCCSPRSIWRNTI